MSQYFLKPPQETIFSLPNLLIFLVSPLLVILLLSKRFKASLFYNKSSPPLPPGPFAWPIVGNIFQIGDNPHQSLARLAETYGPLMSLKLGSTIVIVGSSPDAAMEILKTHDRNLSARYIPDVAPSNWEREVHNCSIGWVEECDDSWKYLRNFSRTELFSGKALNSQARIRDEKVKQMLGFVGKMQGKTVRIRETTFAAVLNMLSNIMVSRDLSQLEHESLNGGICELMGNLIDVASSANISDYYRVLAPLDLQGLQKRAKELGKRICKLWEEIMKEKKANEKKRSDGDHDDDQIDSGSPQDFLDALIEKGFSNDQIDILLRELFSAGSETSSSTVEFTMAHLIRKPRCMEILQEELAREIGPDHVVKESDLSKLNYLQACIKEVLRLHPTGPLLLPHRADESCTVMNYTIPKDSKVLVNAWAIGRNPSYWEDPLEFKPERFLNSSLDFKGNDFEYIPFGSGRRICPGMTMAAKQIPLIVASLVHSFDWSLPQGMSPDDIDMSEKFGIAMRMKEPLLLVPKAKNF
ncbi:hypothetical protein TIFTF001_003620 [Ficus carica]|uniref:Cytochrome P450 n=1 Tax=Ficus carica TaxID=3494 RepID=A0AA88CVT2_FICCA|nr:hypothetical protein TIFTF001_003620 [Ficus carica]